MATEREYELEDKLWDVLREIHEYIIAENKARRGDNSALLAAAIRLSLRVEDWRDNPEWYLQHPRWNDGWLENTADGGR